MNVVSIAGLSSSGKDATADIFVKHGYVKVSMADPLKRFCKDLWEFSDNQIFGPSKFRNIPDERYPTKYKYSVVKDIHGNVIEEVRQEPIEYLVPRMPLQKIGTDIFRMIDPDVWARKAINTAKALLAKDGSARTVQYTQSEGIFHAEDHEPYKGVVIADIRFINELKYVRDVGGITIRIKRPDAGLQGDFGKHISELEMQNLFDDEFDFIINNNKSLKDLDKAVNIIVEQIASNQKTQEETSK